MGGVRENIIWGNLRPVLGKLVSSTLDQAKNDPIIQKKAIIPKKKKKKQGERVKDMEFPWVLRR